MKTVILITFLFLNACVTPALTPIVQPSVQPATTKAPKVENLAVAACAYVAQHTDPQAKCGPTRGRGSNLPDETDAAVCFGTTSIIYCQTPDNDTPTIKILADWSAVKTTQPEPEPVKKSKQK